MCRQIFPAASPADLVACYAYPDGQRWVRANMITSADGAVEVGGVSSGLSGRADRTVLGLLRALADVVLVGAGTARDEGYSPARIATRWAGLRAGRPAAPPIAVLSGSLDLDLAGPLLSRPAAARTIVITCAAAPAARRAELARHADVIIAGDERVDPGAALGALAERGLQRILTEGGPHLLGQLAASGLIDELCLTISPVLAGGSAGRIIQGSPAVLSRLTLAQVLTDDGYLLCRYVRAS